MPTRWHPDTCDCVVQYDDQGQLVVFEKACARHSTADQAAFDALLAGNRLKNRVVNAAETVRVGSVQNWSIGDDGKIVLVVNDVGGDKARIVEAVGADATVL